MSESSDLPGTPPAVEVPEQAGLGAVAGPSGLAWLPVGLLVIGVDQLVKWAVVSHLTPYQPFPVLPPVLDFTLMYNSGAAFSFLSDASGWQRWLFIALAIGVSSGILLWLSRLRARSQGLLACSLALILGGALGNVIDRVRIAHVVDFIHAHWNGHPFPAFNVADSAITIGAALLLLDVWREGRSSKKGSSAT
jgi:signal peptidase II